MIIRLFIVISLIMLLLPAHPRIAKDPDVIPPKPAREKSKMAHREDPPLYLDGSLAVFLKGRTLTFKYPTGGATSSLTLPQPAGGYNHEEQENRRPAAKRKGDTLWLTYNGSVYSVLIGPPPAPSGVYPDPCCDGDKVIVDKNKNLLYLYKNGELARVYRVATGEKPEYTPEGKFTVMNKYSIPPDPGKERFGPRWLGIGVPSDRDLRSEKPDQRAPRGIKYGIHGTDEPDSIGTYASGGCVRLSNTDILELYDLVDVNTPVEIIR